MSRTLKRPMFRKGGEVMEGIMTGIKPREKFSLGTQDQGLVDNVKRKMNLIDVVAGGTSPLSDPLTQFLLTAGPDLVEGKAAGGTKLQEIIGGIRPGLQAATKTQQLKDIQNRKLATQLISKSTIGDAAKAWSDYGQYTGLSKEEFFRQFGRSKLYKDEPTPEMKKAKIKGDIIKNLTGIQNIFGKKMFNQFEAESIGDAMIEAQKNPDFFKQVDLSKPYMPKDVSVEKVKGGYVPSDTEDFNPNKLYFDYNNILGLPEASWVLFDGEKLRPVSMSKSGE